MKTRICLGGDGSDSDDWTAIRAETVDGYQFTPTYDVGGDEFPTIWNPAEFGGRIPRGTVNAAVDQLFDRYEVERFYFDPPGWPTEIETWKLRHGDNIVHGWETYRVKQMHASLVRFLSDLNSGLITHDGCPLTALNMANARKVPKPFQAYLLSKPHGAYHQKIDVAMASVLAHEAAAGARATGWTDKELSSGLRVW